MRCLEMATRKRRNKDRRERRRAKREADSKVMSRIMKTMDRLELYSETNIIINEMMELVGGLKGTPYWYSR